MTPGNLCRLMRLPALAAGRFLGLTNPCGVKLSLRVRMPMPVVLIFCLTCWALLKSIQIIMAATVSVQALDPEMAIKIDDEEDMAVEPKADPGRKSFFDLLMKSRFPATTKTTRSSTSTKRKLEAESSTQTETTTTTMTMVATSASPSPSKKRRAPSKYAPPETYAHLNHLTDSIAPSLICLFVGLNPGLRTATSGHAYAHPSNLFWKLLHSSGCTPRRCAPVEDQDLPRLFSLGNTNIVARPTKDQAELSREEMVASVTILEEKVRKWKPEAVCLVGKSIWESVWKARHGKTLKKKEFQYGWQHQRENMGQVKGGDVDKAWKGARVFVATSTSGLAASTSPLEKETIWRPLGSWVQQRRDERAAKGVGDEEEGTEALKDEEDTEDE